MLAYRMGLLSWSKYGSSYNTFILMHALKLSYPSIYVPPKSVEKRKRRILHFKRLRCFCMKEEFEIFNKEKLQHAKAEIFFLMVLHTLF